MNKGLLVNSGMSLGLARTVYLLADDVGRLHRLGATAISLVAIDAMLAVGRRQVTIVVVLWVRVALRIRLKVRRRVLAATFRCVDGGVGVVFPSL